MNTRPSFPILNTRGKSSVPWAFVEQCRAQAERNHGQSLERLAIRGGLSWAELYMCLTKQIWKQQTQHEDAAREAVLSAFNWEQEERENLNLERIEILKERYTAKLPPVAP